MQLETVKIKGQLIMVLANPMAVVFGQKLQITNICSASNSKAQVKKMLLSVFFKKWLVKNSLGQYREDIKIDEQKKNSSETLGDSLTWLVDSLVIPGWESMWVQIHHCFARNYCSKWNQQPIKCLFIEVERYHWVWWLNALRLNNTK